MNTPIKITRRKVNYSLAFLSAVLLTLSFPRFSQDYFAWLALIPLLAAIRNTQNRTESLCLGLFTGIIFFGVSVSWLTQVTTFGWLFVATIEALFFGAFGWFAYEGIHSKSSFLRVLWPALVWASMEWLRAEIPVFGFGWNLLGYSQSHSLVIVQTANAIGVYGVGFFIVLVNAAILELIVLNFKVRQDASKLFNRISVLGLFWVAVLILGFSLVIAHGRYHLAYRSKQPRTIKASVVQGNIPQILKWESVAKAKIIEIYNQLTELSGFEASDLIVWPEAAFPGYFNRDIQAQSIYDTIRQAGATTVVGSPHFEDTEIAYNSAYLINRDGTVADRYDKLFLVPFGEYVPLKPIFGWLEPYAYSMGVSDFSSGRDYKVFRSELQVPFSVLICFEDIIPFVARRFVEQGAKFLAVITNDAWFGKTAAPYQHLQGSIFRAVENGVSIVRAANTGVSAFITPRGEVYGKIRDIEGNDIFITGHETAEISIDPILTLYRRGGYYFPYFAFALFLAGLMLFRFKSIKR